MSTIIARKGVSGHRLPQAKSGALLSGGSTFVQIWLSVGGPTDSTFDTRLGLLWKEGVGQNDSEIPLPLFTWQQNCVRHMRWAAFAYRKLLAKSKNNPYVLKVSSHFQENENKDIKKNVTN